MTTIARTTSQDGSHWYYPDAKPCYELPKKDGSGMKVPTLADARKLNLLPSVTTILKVLHKQALVEWLIEQSVLAVLTTPRNEGEELDAFIERVLHSEKIQDQEATKARELGTDMHAGLEALFGGGQIDDELRPWIEPAYLAIKNYGSTVQCEKILVGEGYAGKTDLIQSAPDCWWIWDWKTTKRLPNKGAYNEHILQASAYARAYLMELKGSDSKTIRTGNVYISTTECGKFVICEHSDWLVPYSEGFSPLVRHWMWTTDYHPKQ